MTHKSNIVYFQFKLLSTHIRFGGQDSGEDDIREPLRRKTRLNKKYVQRGYGIEIAGTNEKGYIRSVCFNFSHFCLQEGLR